MCNQKRILIIDDEYAIRNTLADILCLKGYEVLTAESGRVGVLKATEEKPHLIICDVSMPGMDGFEVANQIRSMSNFIAVPFIFLSANTAPKDIRKGLMHGADDYVMKPFEVSELLETISMRLNRVELLAVNAEKWTKSITYAKTIQDVILPTSQRMQSLFSSYFCFYQPRDIISGDFYWVHQALQGTFVAAIDCTGHGVPGAMLSMVCYEKLNQVVIEYPQATPSEILNRTNALLKEFMQPDQAKNQHWDGMAISICFINYEKMELIFAGASQSLYLTSKHLYEENGVLTMQQSNAVQNLYKLKGDKFEIGCSMEGHTFREHTVPFSKKDRIFLFSDGFADQFGGATLNGKKFKISNFQKLILSTSNLDMHEQGKELMEIFNDWKGNQDQTDDVLVLGVEF